MSQAFLKDFSQVSKASLMENNQKLQKCRIYNFLTQFLFFLVNATNENNMENTRNSNFFDPQLDNLKE